MIRKSSPRPIHSRRAEQVGRMDIFAVHALAGIVGLLMTGLFAQASVAANDGFSEIAGGWMDRNWIQLAKQLAWVCFPYLILLKTRLQ